MAMVWHDKGIRQYCLIVGGNGSYWPNIAIKASYVFLHQVDIILSIFAVSIGLTELNPLIRNLLDAPLQLLCVKLIIPLLIAWLIPTKLLIPAIVFLFMVVCWNVKELLLLLF